MDVFLTEGYTFCIQRNYISDDISIGDRIYPTSNINALCEVVSIDHYTVELSLDCGKDIIPKIYLDCEVWEKFNGYKKFGISEIDIDLLQSIYSEIIEIKNLTYNTKNNFSSGTE